MKRLLVLALAVVMALGGTALVLAQEPESLAGDKIPVYLRVLPFASLDVNSETLELLLEKPDYDTPLYKTDIRDFTITTNAPVTVTLSINDIVAKIKEIFDLRDEQVWTSNNKVPDYIVSPNLAVDRGHEPNAGGWAWNGEEIVIDEIDGPGVYEFKLRFESRWNLNADEWWKINAIEGAELGNIVITVAATPSV